MTDADRNRRYEYRDFESERDRRYDERFAYQEKALALRSTEIERRLEVLNHAHEEAVRVQHTYVTQDKYDALHNDLVRRIDLLEQWKARATGVAMILTVFAGTIGAAIVRIFHL